MTTSQINPTNINAAYPVAGQDNNTQGFRDNFNNIRTNFEYAESEINSLLSNSVLKGEASNDFAGSIIYGARLQNTGYVQVNQGNIAPTANINFASGSFQTITANDNTTLSFLNLPVSGTTAVLTLAIEARAANATAEPYSVTVANVSAASSGIIGYNPSTGILSFPRTNSTIAGTHTYQLITDDQGSSFTVTPLSTLAAPLNSSSEDVANGNVVNLGVSDSYFSTSASETATLPAGVNGQVKVLAMKETSGDMVITVANPAWPGLGTITFTTAGAACTLKYISDKWFCIGNNGCTFA